MGSIEPFNRLVKLAASAFSDHINGEGENQSKSRKRENRGIAVVILDALTRRQWVSEEDLAKELKLYSEQLRRILHLFEEEKLIQRKESDGLSHSYCCLDYSQIYDIVRYKLHRMKKKLRDEVDNKNRVLEYICPKCGKRYSALDVLQLVSTQDEYFHCESCNGELVAETADGEDKIGENWKTCFIGWKNNSSH